jgi:hypothetical protein
MRRLKQEEEGNVRIGRGRGGDEKERKELRKIQTYIRPLGHLEYGRRRRRRRCLKSAKKTLKPKL